MSTLSGFGYSFTGESRLTSFICFLGSDSSRFSMISCSN